MGEGTKKPATKTEDEVQRKFREALERKTSAAKANDSGRGKQAGSSGVGPAVNDRQKRQFRRKSGG
jgi:hypothetical protein